MSRLHATAVARLAQGNWRAVLLRGPSGSGKSDLALRLIGRGWRLVGDDYVDVWASGGGLYVAPAPRIGGVIEARGLGLIAAPRLDLASVALLIDCDAVVERLPDPVTETLAGVTVPRLTLAALEASAPDKVDAALLGRDMASRLEP